MENSLGNPARGDAFYPRKKEVDKIYKVIDSGASIYLSAPRRVGKTSILKHLEDFPRNGYYFIYVITESVDESNEFFKTLFEDLIKSEAIKKLAKASSAVRDAIAGILGIVKTINDIELRESGESDYYDLLVKLFSKIVEEKGKVILMIDEFPQTIQNIHEKNGDGKRDAEKFLQRNRELRMHKNFLGRISFIYTGSVSLFPMVEKVTELTAVNDIKTVEVDPLNDAEAENFIGLLLKNEGIVLNDKIMNYVLNKISWHIPFHLQLIQQEILDVYESSKGEINEGMIDKAFDQVVHSRNKPQFQPYFSRLKKIFKGSECDFVMEVLQVIASKDSLDKGILNDLAIKYGVTDVRSILQTLEADGYIFLKDKEYRYTSPILQLWCKKHICQ